MSETPHLPEKLVANTQNCQLVHELGQAVAEMGGQLSQEQALEVENAVDSIVSSEAFAASWMVYEKDEPYGSIVHFYLDCINSQGLAPSTVNSALNALDKLAQAGISCEEHFLLTIRQVPHTDTSIEDHHKFVTDITNTGNPHKLLWHYRRR